MLGARIEEDTHKRRRHLAHRIDLGIGEDPLALIIGDRPYHQLGSDITQVARLRACTDFTFELITLTGANHSQEYFATELGDLDLPELICAACT